MTEIVLFRGKRTFDTLEEVKQFKNEIGNRYLRTYRCDYPDMSFYIVEFVEDTED